MKILALGLLLIVAFSGCAQPAPLAATSEPAMATHDDTMQLSTSGSPAEDPSPVKPLPANVMVGVSSNPQTSGDPHVAVPILVKLNVYQITVPSRTVSRNDEFWKHVDEHAVDPAAYDVLYKNGIRVGIAPQQDYAYFHDILMKDYVVTQKTDKAGGDRPASMEIELKPAQTSQVIFWYDSDSFLTGQRYDWCQNLLSVYFFPTPRRPGAVNVTVTPLLRSTQETIEYTKLENEIIPHIKEVYPEYFFDLRVRTTIPVDSFMVIGPSPLAQTKTTLGQTLLMHDGKGEQFETVVLISPLAFRLDEASTQPGPGTQAAPWKSE